MEAFATVVFPTTSFSKVFCLCWGLCTSAVPAEAKGGQGRVDALKLELQVLMSASKYVLKTKHRPCAHLSSPMNYTYFIVEFVILNLSN